MKVPYFHIDAFVGGMMKGNAAGVCALESWLPDNTLQSIAYENNLSETAFIVPAGKAYDLRWFTPRVEVDLCGHATLASAYVVFHHQRHESDRVRFLTKSGVLEVLRDGDMLVMDFPSRPPALIAPPPGLLEGLKLAPMEVHRSRDFLCVYQDESEVKSLQPEMTKLAQLDALGIICTARGRESDFVSRFFAPGAGIDEDPVTGSSHCTLVPFWADRLGKTELYARQISERGGELWCEQRGDRVRIKGRVSLHIEGIISLPTVDGHSNN